MSDIPVRGDPMDAYPLPYQVEIWREWRDCAHGMHDTHARIIFPDSMTDIGCGSSIFGAMREALRRTPVLEPVTA